jgi:hypothetical protein
MGPSELTLANRSKSSDLPPLEEAVIEWLEGERLGQSRKQLVDEIDRLARTCKLWPAATRGQWERAIDSVVKQNLITETDGTLRLAEQVETESKDAEQLELF